MAIIKLMRSVAIIVVIFGFGGGRAIGSRSAVANSDAFADCWTNGKFGSLTDDAA